jgi:hypothetical protein
MFPPFLRNVFSQPEVAHACDPPLGMLGQEDCEFKASPGYLERPCLKKKKKICSHLMLFPSIKYGFFSGWFKKVFSIYFQFFLVIY